MNIYGKRVVLRAMTRNDLGMIVEMFNDPEIERQAGGWSFPLSSEQQSRWFEEHMDGEEKSFIIEDYKLGPVGVVRLFDLNWKNRNVVIGFKIGKKEHRGQGIGTDAYMAIIRYCFDELGLHRINASYLESNIASQKVHSKCGFVVEGRIRDSQYQKGKWVDVISVGLLEKDYRSLIKHNHYWD